MFRTALRNVLAHKVRLLMTVLAVLLGVSFVSGTLVFTSTISEAYQRSSEEGFSHVDLAVEPRKPSGNGGLGSAPALSQGLLDELAALPGTATATGDASGFAALADRDGELVGEGWSTLGANYWAGPDGEGPDARYAMDDGRAPRSAGEVALDEKTAERTGYEVGDTVRMSVNGPVREEKVTGVFSTDDGNVAAGGTLVLFDTETAQKLWTADGEFDRITLTAAEGTSEAQLKKQVEEVLPADSEAATGEQLAAEQARVIEEGMSVMKTVMLVFAGISLFVGVFIIANTFTMLVAQRTKELALLRAVGASRRQVTRSVLAEALLVGAVAGVTGLLAGIGIAMGMRALVGSLAGTLPDGPLMVGTDAVAGSLLVGVLVTVLAAWLPARRAAKIPPVAAMSSVHATATTRSLVIRNSIGSFLVAAGAVLVLLGTSMSMEDGKFPMGAGAALTVLGVFVLTPLLSRPLIASVGPLLRGFGVSGKLARQNAVRSPRRTAATASALMIGLTLITGLTVIAGSAQQAIEKMAVQSLKSDYMISMANYSPLSPEVEKILAENDKVTAISPMNDSLARVDGDFHSLTGVSGEDITKVTDLSFTAGSADDLAGNRVITDEAIAEEEGWKVGSTFPVTFVDNKKGELTVAGVFEGNQVLNGIMLDTATLAPHVAEVGTRQLLVRTEGGVSEEAKSSLVDSLGNNPAVLVQDKQDVSDSIAGSISLMLNMLYGLLAMAVIVAVLGVVNTLAMSVFERSQEIGMLRAIGLDRRAVKRMVRLESVIISLFGGVMGIGLGVFFGWAAGQVIGDSLGTYEMVLPWGRMGVFLALAALVGVLAALWPARRAARMNMLAAIKSE